MTQLAHERIELFGISFSKLTFNDLCIVIEQSIRENTPIYVVTPNVDHICKLRHDKSFREAYAHAHVVLADGTSVIWASRWCGKPLPEKLSGSDLVPALCEIAAQKHFSVFFFGAAPGVAQKAAEKLLQQHPSLIVSGWYSPPYGFFQDEQKIIEALQIIRNAAPDICFVALGSPQQEIWMYQYHAQSGAKVMIGVGAGIDFVAGVQKRAPKWIQKIGLEWLWRLAHEPRRLWRRYLVDDLTFFPILLKELWHQRIRSSKKTGEFKYLG